jgi:hypothetical protein
MLPVFFMIAAQPPVVESTTVDALEDDIVVIARKMTEWRGSVQWKGDVITCKTTRSTKNATVDKLGCDALVGCTTSDVRAEIDALKDRKIPKSDRARRSQVVNLKVNECAEETAQNHINTLAQQRAAAR